MPNLANRRGFTLLEVMISMFLLLMIIAITVSTFQKSSTLLAGQSGRLDAQQSARFAMTSLDRDLRVAGVGIVDMQPLLVEASNTAIVFNADLISRVPGDIGAVYVDTSADSAATTVMRSTDKLLLPGLSVYYPDSTYTQLSGIRSGAETIAYYLSKDTSNAAGNVYILYRRLNATPPQVIARDIQYNTGDTVFQYSKIDTTGKVTVIPMTSLPLYHKATIHGSIADTGKFALVDSIMSVTVTLNAIYRDPKTNITTTRPLTATVRIMNAGLVHRTTCGNEPVAVSVTATTSAVGDPTPYVQLNWSHSIDDGGGEKDVETYAIYRRLSSATTFDQPFASVPAGQSSYTFTDSNVSSGDSWVYGVSAQDCTPSSSSIGATTIVVVP